VAPYPAFGPEGFRFFGGVKLLAGLQRSPVEVIEYQESSQAVTVEKAQEIFLSAA
jgi:hypothetical protein